MKRRSFLQLLAGGVAALAAGVKTVEAADVSFEPEVWEKMDDGFKFIVDPHPLRFVFNQTGGFDNIELFKERETPRGRVCGPNPDYFRKATHEAKTYRNSKTGKFLIVLEELPPYEPLVSVPTNCQPCPTP